MTLEQIQNLISNPEKLIEPGQINILSGYLNGYISDLEEQLNEENYSVSCKWADMRKEIKSNAEVDRAIELTDIYRQREKTKILLARLKRFRSDIKDRFAILTNQKWH